MLKGVSSVGLQPPLIEYLVQQMVMINVRKVNMGEQVTVIVLGYASLPFAITLLEALQTLWRLVG